MFGIFREAQDGDRSAWYQITSQKPLGMFRWYMNYGLQKHLLFQADLEKIHLTNGSLGFLVDLCVFWYFFGISQSY